VSYKSKLELSKAKNSPTKREKVKPQARDQSYKTLKKISKSLSIAVFLSSQKYGYFTPAK
jgi:hypothetical protein